MQNMEEKHMQAEIAMLQKFEENKLEIAQKLRSVMLSSPKTCSKCVGIWRPELPPLEGEGQREPV